ncbi:MAG: hypothetical protein NVS3B26_03880 [Mycobacteriales bacterium]
MSAEPIFSFRPSDQPRYPWARLETLLDGIIAIAATLLVLDLRVPTTHQPGQLGAALLHLWPQYLAYALGFLQVMAGWISTRRLSASMVGLDHYATLGMLFTTAFFILTPFTCSVLASAIRNREDLGSATRLMSLVLVASMAFLGPTVFYMYRRGFHRVDLDDRRLKVGLLLFCTAWLWPVVAFAASYASPVAALTVLAVYFVMNLSPIETMTTEQYYSRHPDAAGPAQRRRAPADGHVPEPRRSARSASRTR